MPVMFLFCSFQFVILQIMLILPILQKTICGSAKKTVQIYTEARSNANLFALVQ